MRTSREGIEELHYDQFIVRLDPSTLTVRECTLLPRTDATINGIKVTWDQSFLRRACELDKFPREIYGFVVLYSLGIAITGINDGDESQLAITVFSAGDFGDPIADSVPFEI